MTGRFQSRISKWLQRQTPSSLFWWLVKYVTLLFAAMAVLVPPYAVVVTSFKTKEEYLATGAMVSPQNWFNFENYLTVFQQGHLGLAFLNTVIILISTLVIVVVMGTMVAYIVSRFEFRGRSVVLMAYIVAMVVPYVTTQVATFEIIRGLGLINNKLSLILLYSGVDVVTIYIYLQFARNIPKELDEAAIMEGAGYFTIYRKVIFPLLWPATATVVILKSIMIYNDFYLPFLYLTDQDQKTVSTVLYGFTNLFGTNYAEISAGIVLIVIPSLILFFVMQKQIFNGVTHGSVKG
ncbi:carbohydrate ABC transporter permease [Gynuella sunshinyii]|uniref:ABC-type sugar transport system, permease component n=1 Tax=Gynuella sunshinyii YC6258 TaxID=1445510 RepID=A0A0C5VYS2_9GAMM|nr:carbohydrate ABC transporter permease [Gynuella sunshinyii]AJQ95559.1 ABC-type sugar transport system, permease component [Gynuella sunshinyii YC6258]